MNASWKTTAYRVVGCNRLDEFPVNPSDPDSTRLEAQAFALARIEELVAGGVNETVASACIELERVQVYGFIGGGR